MWQEPQRQRRGGMISYILYRERQRGMQRGLRQGPRGRVKREMPQIKYG